MNLYLLSLVAHWASFYGLDPYLAAGVVQVESRFVPHVVGTHGEVGLFQVRPSSVGVAKASLFRPDINVAVGTRYLHDVARRCNFMPDNSFVVCYNRGVKGARRVADPLNDVYYKKVMAASAQWKQMAATDPTIAAIFNGALKVKQDD